MIEKIWRPVLGAAAEQDPVDIVRWTAENFGPVQATIYRDMILSALNELKVGPGVAGARRREDIGAGLMTFRIAHRGKRARHFLLIRPLDRDVIEILRILHTSMDIERHIPDIDFDVEDDGAGMADA